MKHEDEIYFGDKNDFAIRYLKNIENSNFAICHLMLAEKIVGDKNEECYLGTWKNSVKILKKKI